MGYAQHVRSPKSGEYWLARYLEADGTYGTVKDEHTGKTVHYDGKRDALKAANSAEAAVREGRAKKLAKEATPAVITFREWASTWYASLNLAASTMFNYKQHLVLHMGYFADHPVTDTGIMRPHVDMWKQQLRDDGHKESSIATYLGTLRACLAAAVRAGLLTNNPAAQGDDAGTGKRGVARAAAAAKAEKVITTILGTIVVGERIAILSGRDDEFTFTVALMGGALRLGEGIGLEARYVSRGNIRVEWQLSQVGPNLIRAIPKDGSRGDVAIPPFLDDLLAWQAGHRPPVPCACHGLSYLFTGPAARKRRDRDGVTVRDVAELAAVTPETVWAALDGDGRLPQAVRGRVRGAAKELGWLTGSAPLDPDWHWRHSAYERLFAAAGSGWWPAKSKREPERPVPLAGEWPGAKLLKYSGAQRLAEWGWPPVARGLTPHSLRHSMRTWMEENRIPYVFSELQLRHEQPSVYRHATESMRGAHRERLQEAWEEALQRRGELHPSSPVGVVDALLRDASEGFVARNSQGATVTALRGRR